MARTRQPQGPASVNWSHPSTRSLIAAAYPVGAGLWLANKGTFHSAQSVSLNTGVTTHGRTVYGPNESVTNFIPLASDTFAAPITMLAAILPVGGGNAACTICSFGSGSSNGRIALQYGAVDLGNQYLRLVSSATAVLATDTFPAFSGANGVGSPEIVAATYAGTSAGYSFWRNGSKSSSGTTASTSALFDGFGALDSSTYPSYQGYTRIAGIFCWSRILSDDELQSLTTKPWPLFAPQRRLWIQLGAAAGGATTSVEPSKGALTVTGYLPGIEQDRAVAPTIGHATLTGYAPGIEQDKAVAPAKGALTLTGYVPTLTHPRSIAAVKGAITVTGYAPTVQQTASGAVAPSKGALALTGYAPGLEQDRTIAPSKGAATVTGYAPGIQQNVTTFIVPSKGAVTVAGYAPGIGTTANQSVAPSTGTLALAGHAPILAQTADQIIGPINGALTLTGNAPTVQVIGAGVTIVEPTAGAITLTGYAPLIGLLLGADALDASRIFDRDPARVGAARIGAQPASREDLALGTATPSPRRPRLG